MKNKKSSCCKSKFLLRFLSLLSEKASLAYAKCAFAISKLSPKLNPKCLTNERPRKSFFLFYRTLKTILYRNFILLVYSNGKIVIRQ